MTNVLCLAERRKERASTHGVERLLKLFAQERHRIDDVRWLKENAELLRLLVATGRCPDPELLYAAYGRFLPNLRDRLHFFPQYYRFFLSIALDLEALGLAEIGAAKMVEWAVSGHLAGAELSDLQRAEARLMAQRVGLEVPEEGLTERLLRFASRAETFALPNRKAAYELTHIAFYLSDYGRHGFAGSGGMIESLENAGLVAHLEGNTDLLAEICIALRQCGSTPPADWEQAVTRGFAAFRLLGEAEPGQVDDYHAWLMAAWSLEASGEKVLEAPLPSANFHFVPPPGPTTLLEVSAALLDLGAARSADWPRMRGCLAPRISGSALAHIDRLAASTPQFESFFARFARVPQRGGLR